jgi:DNA modification methylase
VKCPGFDYNDVTVPIITKNLKPGSYCHKNTDGTIRKGSPINTNAKNKNMRDFWDSEIIQTASCNQKSPFLPKGTNHAAPFPVEIPNICIAKVCKPGDKVLDPFCGSGSTGEAALMNGCNFIGYELIQKSANIAKYRLQKCQQHIASFSAKAKAKVLSIAPSQQSRKAA